MNEQVKPCFWMRIALNRLVDGDLKGVLGWYAKRHLEKCRQCTKTYQMLLQIRDRLRSSGKDELTSWVISDEKWQEIEAACDHMSKPKTSEKES